MMLLLPDSALAGASKDTVEPDNLTDTSQAPSSIAEVKVGGLRPRRPVETPPTEYLPYPPPDNYQWPPGQSPDTENPK